MRIHKLQSACSRLANGAACDELWDEVTTNSSQDICLTYVTRQREIYSERERERERNSNTEQERGMCDGIRLHFQDGNQSWTCLKCNLAHEQLPSCASNRIWIPIKASLSHSHSNNLPSPVIEVKTCVYMIAIRFAQFKFRNLCMLKITKIRYSIEKVILLDPY